MSGWRYSPTRDARTARTWPPAGVCLVGKVSPPSDAPRRTRPALRCPGAARAAQPQDGDEQPKLVLRERQVLIGGTLIDFRRRDR
jgi:hypothetical protein